MDIWIGRVSYPLGIIHHKEQHELNKPGEPSFVTGELSPSISTVKWVQCLEACTVEIQVENKLFGVEVPVMQKILKAKLQLK